MYKYTPPLKSVCAYHIFVCYYLVLTSNERDSIFSNAEHSTVYLRCNVFFILITSIIFLLQFLDILHNHTKTDILMGLVISQKAMKYSSTIRNTFNGISSPHTCIAYKWATTTSFSINKLEIALKCDLVIDISILEIIILPRSVIYTIVANHTNQNMIILQLLIIIICINRFHQSRAARLTKNTVNI